MKFNDDLKTELYLFWIVIITIIKIAYIIILCFPSMITMAYIETDFFFFFISDTYCHNK